MQEQMDFQLKNYRFELVKFPKAERKLKNKWVCKTKLEENKSQAKYKTRVFLKGFNQRKVLTLKKFLTCGEDNFYLTCIWINKQLKPRS